MKKPIIATDVGGISESISKENGFLIKKGNYENWIDKISLLLEDEKMLRLMGENSHKFVKNNFMWDKIADDFIDILTQKTDLIKD